MPPPDPIPFPTEAFERLRRVKVGEPGVHDPSGRANNEVIQGRIWADEGALADWALAAVPRMRERNLEIAENCNRYDAPRARANLADLGVT